MKKIRYFLPCFMVLSLASCQVAVKLEMTNYESNISFPKIKKNEEGEGFYRLKEYQPLSYGLDNKTINSLYYCKKSKLYSVKFEKLYEYCPLPEHKEEPYKSFNGETVERCSGETYMPNTGKLDQSYGTITGGKLPHMKYVVENSIGDDKKKPKLNLNV